MSPTFVQEPDRLRLRVIALLGAGLVFATIALAWIAWLFVRPAPLAGSPSPPSSLQRRLFDGTRSGAVDPGPAQSLERYDWIDRPHHIARIPIERAIDAVVADPHLIGGHVGQVAP